jgi:hypothetical protein
MPKRILTIGLELGSDDVHEEEFSSKASLLDWDIILFKPDIWALTLARGDDYQGKPCLTDAASFTLKEVCEHWRREIKQALEAGKTIIVFLSPVMEVFAATGEKKWSGTGRNARATRFVALQSNYDTLPIPLSPMNATGRAIKLAPRGGDLISAYWAEFGSISEYKVRLAPNTAGQCLLTKHGDHPVGGILRGKTSSGSLVLLPDIDFYAEDFWEEQDEGHVWTNQGKQFANRMISAVVALDAALHASAEITPEPAWATEPQFSLPAEIALRSELLESERKLEEAQRRKEDVLNRYKESGRLRALLYEKGKPLEIAIIDALKLLGFKAAPYKDAESEFDVVFECPEGRLLGEAEGKDARAINIDKLRQLSMNIHEDLQGEDVEVPAKGVLFGNGYRLMPPKERAETFTAKCITAATSSGTALVATMELFKAAQHLSESQDDEYSKQCREVLLTGAGVVTLPNPPIKEIVAAAEVTTTPSAEAG